MLLLALDKKTGNLLFGSSLLSTLDEACLSYKSTQTKGILVNFDNEILLFEDLLEQFSEKQNLNDFAIAMSLKCFTPEKIKERVFEIIFEYFDVGGVQIFNPQVHKL